MMNFRKLLQGTLLTAVSASLLTACSGSSSSDGGSTANVMTIAGTLGLSTRAMADANPFAISLTDLEIYAICLADSPDIGQGDIGADGAFSVDLTCPVGSIVTAVFRNKTSEDEVATVVFEDSTDVGIDGEPKKSSAFKLSGNVSVGAITLNQDTGEVVIPISQISAPTVETGSGDGSDHNMNGQWTVAQASTSSLPTGFQGACAVGDNTCHGPTVGETVDFTQINGLKWNRDSACSTAATAGTFDPTSDTCAGTASTDKKSVLMMFTSADGKAACGTSGFNEQAAKAFGGIYFQNSDFTGTGLTLGFHTFDATLTDGWKHSGAKTQWTMHNCRPFDLPGDLTSDTDAATFLNGATVGWACAVNDADDQVGTDSSGTTWRVGAGGGCFITGTNTPVFIKDWSQVQGSWTPVTGLPTGWSGGSGNYTNVDHDDDGATAAINVTCKHLGAYYTDNTGAPGTLITTSGSDGDGNANEWGTEDTVASGTACSAIDGGTSVQALRCYADFYNQKLRRGGPVGDVNGDSDSSDAGEGVLCTKRVNFDWSNDDANAFVNSNSSWSAAQDFVGVMGVAGDSFTVEDESRVENRGIDTGTSWIPCRVASSGKIMFTKKSATQYVIAYTRTGVLVDVDKPACLAAAQSPDGAASLEVGPQKFMFLLNKN